jgi:hypothetical protein
LGAKYYLDAFQAIVFIEIKPHAGTPPGKRGGRSALQDPPFIIAFIKNVNVTLPKFVC